ncbi:putative HECT-domain-containing protein [Rosellinia necatrix]|uniref:HECT-type E3 ubiquitin transferase n=1 Tax=Rosellinia necatrix TaxID=77044 RepID=A0A1W2TV43_ROSNE|nr:putative HECT-domain-containing protein [Rosellinia necatrix]
MTIEPTRPVHHGRGRSVRDDDVLAALWENAPFPKLPYDAPPELKELVVDVENPKRVYTIHRASRRHNLQLLIDRFVFQLRCGCSNSSCSTATCFTYRKRLAGKAPIRRYNPNTARTLAVYLASQDNPEGRLCPYLQVPGTPSDAILPLHVVPKHPSTRERVKARLSPTKNHSPGNTSSSIRQASLYSRQDRQAEDDDILSPSKTAQTAARTANNDSVPIQITEKPVGKRDYRSFATAVFGTVAFKMLEWLAPNNVEALTDIIETSRCSTKSSIKSQTSLSSDDTSDQFISPGAVSCDDSDGGITIARKVTGYGIPYPEITTVVNTTELHSNTSIERPSRETPTRALQPRKKSNTKIRTSSGSQPSKVVVEPIADSADNTPIDSPDSVSEATVPSSARRSTSRPHSKDLSDTNTNARSPRQIDGEYAVNDRLGQIDGLDDIFITETDYASISAQSENSQNGTLLGPAPELDSHLPQSLSRLNPDAVSFLCDVLQEDATAERHVLEPPIISDSPRHYTGRRKVWRRKRKAHVPYSPNLKYEWKLFVEQSIFHVLSDPQALLESFTTRDGAVDSQTVWYCMLRLTRVVPHLVFDSLWIATKSLFAPPRSLQTSRSPTAKMFATPQRSFSNAETASLMSICFHALIAAAPLVTDSRLLLDMSRIRSRGLLLTGSGLVRDQRTLLSLQYEDAFADDLALRLARRLLMAILTRHYFNELLEVDLDLLDSTKEPDVLESLLSQIEPSMQSSMRFSKLERAIHEKRVPILLLDWARTVMIQEWTGKPEVPGDGAFGGALLLIAAMYRKRQTLLLGDAHFRFEFFGDRLDVVDMPVSWLSFTSTRQKAHLLDYPFIFKPESLVSYFRAINFSMMSHSYEEAASLQLRIRMITEPTSLALATEPHQRGALEDLLKTPTSKFLILNIRRDWILLDAFDQIWRREQRELMRPLKIHLGEDSGEEGYDYGGVQQEFFRLAIAEALDPVYGAFTIDGRTRMTWFQPGSLQPEWKYELIGLLVSLAIYNGLTLPVTFPKALYRKLLGEQVTELHHIADGWPDLANGLTNLLEWNENDGAVEDVFVVTYEFSTMMLGQPVSRRMDSPQESWPQSSLRPSAEPPSVDNPMDAPLVTGDNRIAYVNDYIRYLTDVSIAPQYEAFARGFRTCLHPKSLKLLTPSLLQSIVEGEQDLDISELRRVARYSGWDANHRTIRDFWAVVKKFDDRMRRKLLEFVTSSDRLPVGGASHIQFVIQKNGEEDGEAARLPTAYTCYGHLLLPEYRDREVLRERLSMAVENAEGFGFA